jgi:hypothetical protein
LTFASLSTFMGVLEMTISASASAYKDSQRSRNGGNYLFLAVTTADGRTTDERAYGPNLVRGSGGRDPAKKISPRPSSVAPLPEGPARIAAIFRVSDMARPHASRRAPQERLELPIYLSEAIRPKEASPSQGDTAVYRRFYPFARTRASPGRCRHNEKPADPLEMKV